MLKPAAPGARFSTILASLLRDRGVRLYSAATLLGGPLWLWKKWRLWRFRAGYAPSKYTFPLTLRVHREGPPSLQLDLSMVRALGAPPVTDNYVGLLAPGAAERAAVAAWPETQGATEKPLVGINMGQYSVQKCALF